MKLPLILFSVILLRVASIRAEKSDMNPDAFLDRSHVPTMAQYIHSRSTGRPYRPSRPVVQAVTRPVPPSAPSFAPSATTAPTPKPEGLSPHTSAPVPPENTQAEVQSDSLQVVAGLNPDILNRLKKYDAMIRHYSKLHNVEPNLTRAVIYVESAGDVRAVSPKGARGLMQLMPGTASDMGVENTFDPAQNIFGGTRYLGRQFDAFGSLDLALWAYNAGPESVKRKFLPGETRNYIPSVMRVKRLLDSGVQ